MKKQTAHRRLTLNRETLRNLDSRMMQGVVGGTDGSLDTYRAPSCRRCPSEGCTEGCATALFTNCQEC